MKYFSQITGKQLKQLGFVTLVVGGLCVEAFAQSPTVSSPGLPPLPSLPALANNNAPAAPTLNIPATPQAPTLAALPIVPLAPAAANVTAANDPSFQPVKLPALEVVKTPVASAQPSVATAPVAEPAAPSAEATEAAAAAKASGVAPVADGSNATPAVAGLPPLGVPGLPPLGLPLPNGGAVENGVAAVSLPEVHVDQEKPKPKILSWQTKLAPAIVAPKTNFIYKREVLPEAIYRESYDRENSHLPNRVTRKDYENLLFASVAQNDINTTRALLNAGTGIEATNEAGETPLAIAKRSGAMDVAALLTARGAR
jgi:hypothetical protein